MPKPRFSGGSVSMRCSSSQMLPPESCIRPTMQLSAVDLPQPEGPSRQMNSPRFTVSVNSFRAAKAWPPAPANLRVTRSSLRSLKSCFMARLAASLGFLGADLAIPFAKRLDDRLGFERRNMGILRQPPLVLRAAEFTDCVLAFLWRHRQRNIFHRWPGIKITLVVGQSLRFRLEQVGHQGPHDGQLLGRHALWDRHVVSGVAAGRA